MNNISETDIDTQEQNEEDGLPNEPAAEIYLVETLHSFGGFSYSFRGSEANAIKCKERWDFDFPKSVHKVVCFVPRDAAEEATRVARKQSIEEMKSAIIALMEEIEQ